MTGTPQFVDVSQFNPETIDWQAYAAWARQWDGIARVAMRSSYGVGYTDQHFVAYRSGALAANIDEIYYYHYAYPQFNSAATEANWQRQVVGDIRTRDKIVLDFEENVAQATAEWAYEWLAQQERNYGGKLPDIYASDAYIRQRLQDSRLARYDPWLANWQYTPDERPPCPPPWTRYAFVQYTDHATNIPGIAGTVDADIFLGGSTMSGVPQGWNDNGSVLTDPNGHTFDGAVRTTILASNWASDNIYQGAIRFDQPAQSVLLEDGRWGNGDVLFFNGSAIAVAWKPDPALTGGTQQTNTTIITPTGNELLWARRELNDANQQIAQLQQEITTLKAASPSVDTSAVIADINAIADGLAPLIAKALVDVKKL